MRLYSLQILFKAEKSKILQASYDLSTFSFFQRGPVREFMDFGARLLCERTERCQRGMVERQDTVCHVYVRHDNLCGVLFSDQEYPPRVAQSVLTKATEDFAAGCPSDRWSTMPEGSGGCKKIDEYLQRYQNPAEADGIMRLQQELDETKGILHNTVESLLARNELLDDLVERSEGLSLQSKMFYTTAKKTNKCCTLL